MCVLCICLFGQVGKVCENVYCGHDRGGYRFLEPVSFWLQTYKVNEF